MTGATKEELQNLETGQFLIKVKSSGILETALNENLAQYLRVTTSYIGERHAMKPKHWQTVKKYQLKQYYKLLNSEFLPVSASEEQNPQDFTQSPENAKFKAFKNKKPIKPMF